MTEDEILSMGDFCEGLKLSPRFQLLVSTFEKNCFDAFMMTDPKAVKEREAVYARFNGAMDFRHQMDLFIAEATKIRERNDQHKLSEYDPMPLDDEDA